MKSGIYMIKNLVTDRVYIGSSVDISKRYKNHIWRLNSGKHINRYLQRSWNKYGEKIFKFEIVEETENLIEREQYWLNEFKKHGKVYNIKIECVNSLKGVKRNKKWNKRISSSNKGRKLSKESRDKMSISKTGCTPWNKGLTKESDERIAKYSLKLSLKILSEEHKEKIRNTLKGESYITNDGREKLSKTHKGKVISKETKKKMSESAIKWRREKVMSEYKKAD